MEEYIDNKGRKRKDFTEKAEKDYYELMNDTKIKYGDKEYSFNKMYQSIVFAYHNKGTDVNSTIIAAVMGDLGVQMPSVFRRGYLKGATPNIFTRKETSKEKIEKHDENLKKWRTKLSEYEADKAVKDSMGFVSDPLKPDLPIPQAEQDPNRPKIPVLASEKWHRRNVERIKRLEKATGKSEEELKNLPEEYINFLNENIQERLFFTNKATQNSVNDFNSRIASASRTTVERATASSETSEIKKRKIIAAEAGVISDINKLKHNQLISAGLSYLGVNKLEKSMWTKGNLMAMLERRVWKWDYLTQDEQGKKEWEKMKKYEDKTLDFQKKVVSNSITGKDAAAEVKNTMSQQTEYKEIFRTESYKNYMKERKKNYKYAAEKLGTHLVPYEAFKKIMQDKIIAEANDD
jgi:hypothetical protein